MIVIQVLLGGITRLTESGLSITEWKPITGMLPPLSDSAWQLEFDKYKNTDQFKYVHQHFSLSQFKYIFFWEWFHRVWARLLGIVFLVGFFYFIYKKKFTKPMIWPMVLLFFLGGIQGAIGWIMVKSGLVPEKYYVGHVELTTHLVGALGLLAYTLWFSLSLLVPDSKKVYHPFLKLFLKIILILLTVQIIYGGFMAGLKAAITAPTWPDINGAIIPANLFTDGTFINSIINNPITIHFIHRGIAYVLALLILIWWWKSSAIKNNSLFSFFRNAAAGLVIAQVALGILTVLNATNKTSLIWLGVSHQFVAMVLLAVIVCLLYLLKKANRAQ